MRKRIAVLGMLIFIYAAISTVAALGDETSLHKAAIDLADRYSKYLYSQIDKADKDFFDKLNIADKLLIVDKYHNETSIDYLDNLEDYYDGIVPKEILAEDLSEVDILVIIGCNTEKTGTYVSGASAFTTYTVIVVVDLNQNIIYGPMNVAIGSPPDKKFDKGDGVGGYYPKKAVRFIVDLYNSVQGNKVTWTLDKDGTLTFSGTGNFDDFTEEKWKIKTIVKKVIIESGIKSICNNAFKNYSELVSITIPESVTRIGKNAFYDCKSLIDITIPESVYIIGDYAFSGCSSLTDITIPNNVIRIGGCAFKGCSKFTEITIPDGVIEIGAWAFANCRSLTNMTIPDNITKIMYSTFWDCSNLSSITIPTSVKSIGVSAFALCDNLNDVYYAGSIDQWQQISIEEGNTQLLNATIHYGN